MLLRFALLIIIISLLYLFKVSFWQFLVVFFAAGTLFFIKEREKRAETLNFLTLVLALAVLVLGKIKGIGFPGILPLSLAALSSPLLALKVSPKKAAVLIAPFWFFTAWAVGEIFASKYHRWGFLLSLVIIPIYLRDLSLKIREERERENDEVQKTE